MRPGRRSPSPGPSASARTARWSRGDVLEWLLGKLPESTLVGLDLGMSLPFADRGAFFPGWADSPARCARTLGIGRRSLRGRSAPIRHKLRRSPPGKSLFPPSRRPRGRSVQAGRRGRRTRAHARDRARAARLRLQALQQFQSRRRGASRQVEPHRHARAAPAGRAPARLADRSVATAGSVVVEIYTSLAAVAAGRRAGQTKLRDVGELNFALAALESRPVRGSGAIADHASDALLTSAWLRRAAHRGEYWRPAAMTAQVAQTEGWTFGAL